MPPTDPADGQPEPLPTQVRPVTPDGTVPHTTDAREDTVNGARAAVTPPQPIPGYEFLDVLGHGGMGIVFKARQIALNRAVALKMILRADRVDKTTVARFWAEAEVMAAVRHANVVQVYELSAHDGHPYIAMEFVGGGSLADRLKPGVGMAPREAAALLEKIARGVGAAHEQGIVHRDLKPANVLLAPDGTPKVADFGLAKRKAADLTQTQAVMGTPAYMAPELASGQAKFVGPTADVWALGVILFESVAGARPFEAETAHGFINLITSTEPPALRARAPHAPRDLGTIVAKCLARDPAARYTTASDLADDLGRFLRGEPIAARAVGAAERALRWVRRNPALAVAGAALALAALLSVVVVVVVDQRREADAAREETEGQRASAVAARKETEEANEKLRRQQDRIERLEYGATVRIAYQMARANRFAEARATLASTKPELRGWEYHYVHRLCHSDLVTLTGHTGQLTSAAFSPNGTRVLTTSHDGTARVWHAHTGKELFVLGGEKKAATVAAFGADGRLVTAGGRTLRVWNAETGAPVHELIGHTDEILALALAPDGVTAVTTSRDKTARLWDIAAGKALHTLAGHTAAVGCASFSRDGKMLVTGGDGARVWEVATGKQRHELKLAKEGCEFALFTPDGTRVLTASRNSNALRLWSADTGERVGLFLSDQRATTLAVAFGPDGERFVTASSDKTASVWSVATQLPLFTIRDFANAPLSATFTPDGTKVVTTQAGGPVRVWSAADGKELAVHAGHNGAVRGVAFAPDGTRMVSFASDPNDLTARVWPVEWSAPQTLIDPRTNPETWSAVFRPDGTRVLTAGLSGNVRSRSAWSGHLFATRRASHAAAFADYDRAGTRAVTAGNDGAMRIWDAELDRTLATFPKQPPGLLATRFSPDGTKLVVAGSTDFRARILDAATGKELAVLKGHFGVVAAARFSPDGTKVVTAGTADKTARVWAVPSAESGVVVTGAELLRLNGHASGLSDAAFSPDGRTVVTAGLDTTVRLWDVSTGKELSALRGHTAPVDSVAFSADGTRLVTTGRDDTVRVWDPLSGAELLSLPGGRCASFSPDGARLLTAVPVGMTWAATIYETKPVNRAFYEPDPAPDPRPR